jgi:hypothetical protein
MPAIFFVNRTKKQIKKILENIIRIKVEVPVKITVIQ